MKLFFTHKEIALKKKRTALVVIGIGLVIGIYLIVSHRPAKMPELPVVAIAPATQDDVEIYGEYVGRVRAQQFVEVRARVEGYLEQMLFAEGTYVTKNQVLFVINQDQYHAECAQYPTRVFHNVFDKPYIFMIADSQPLIDTAEYDILFLVRIFRFQDKRTHDWTQCQSYYRRQQYGYYDGYRKLAIKLSGNST